MDKDLKINNHTDMDINALSGEITKFYPYAKEKLGFDKPVIVNLLSDVENGKNIFGKTAQYNPSSMTIDIFVDGRHPKDILRSLSHELVHHTQNCRGDFNKLSSTEQGYAQKNPFLRKLEAEAYLLGNGLLFRDFEDMRKSKMKTNENKFNLRDMIKNMLNETINEYVDTMESIDEDGYEEDPIDPTFEEDLDEAKVDWSTYRGRMAAKKTMSKKDWKKGMNKWWAERRAKKTAKKKTDKPKEITYDYSDEPDTIRVTPKQQRKFAKRQKRRKALRSSKRQNALLQKLLRLTDPAAKPKAVAKKAGKPKAPKKAAAPKGAPRGTRDLADEIGLTSIKPGKFKGIKGLGKKIAGKTPTLRSRKIKVASPEQMASWAGKGKAPATKVAKKKPTPSHPSPKGAPVPPKPQVAKKKTDKPKTRQAEPGRPVLKTPTNENLNENLDTRSNDEWYNDTLFENLVKKWTKK